MDTEYNIMLFACTLSAYCQKFGFGDIRANEDDFQYCVEQVREKMSFLCLHDFEIESAVRIAREILKAKEKI